MRVDLMIPVAVWDKAEVIDVVIFRDLGIETEEVHARRDGYGVWH